MKSVVIDMANNGWIKLHREILDNALFHNEKLLKVFIWCTLKATHEEHDQLVGRQIVRLLPGQFVTGRHRASEELRLKPSTAWDYLKVLETNNTISIKSDNKFSVITIVNWSLYQSKDGLTDNKTDNKTDNLSDNKSTTNRHKQEQKNDKNKEDKDIYGDFSNVRLSKDEYEKLINTYSEKTTKEFVEKLDAYIASTGKKYKNHYATILTWIRKDPSTRKINQGPVKMTIDA